MYFGWNESVCEHDYKTKSGAQNYAYIYLDGRDTHTHETRRNKRTTEAHKTKAKPTTTTTLLKDFLLKKKYTSKASVINIKLPPLRRTHKWK